MADSKGLPIWLEPSPIALHLYRTFRFRNVGEAIFDLGNFGGDGCYTQVCMVRDPKIS